MILLAVGWYLRFSLSYRDVEELLAEKGLRADHVTVWRWVQRYAPEMERRLRRRLKPTNDSWRVDETYVRVKGKWVYLYRAVDYLDGLLLFRVTSPRFSIKPVSWTWTASVFSQSCRSSILQSFHAPSLFGRKSKQRRYPGTIEPGWATRGETAMTHERR